MAVLHDVKWEPSQHEGLQMFYDGFETWFRCTECEYCNTRLYHARMHYLRIHVEGGRPCKKKRKFVPDAKKAKAENGATASPAPAKPKVQTTLPAFLSSTKPRRVAKRSRNTKQKKAAVEAPARAAAVTNAVVCSPLPSQDDFPGSFDSSLFPSHFPSLFPSPLQDAPYGMRHTNESASPLSASPFPEPEFLDGEEFGGIMPLSPVCDNDASDSELAHHGLWADPPPPPSPRERRPERGSGRIHCARIMRTVFVFGHYDMLRCAEEPEGGEEPEH